MNSVQDLIGFFGGSAKPIKPFRQGGNFFADVVDGLCRGVDDGVKALAGRLVPLDDVSGKQAAPLEVVPVVNLQTGGVGEAVSAPTKMEGSDSLEGERVASVAAGDVVSSQNSVELAEYPLVSLRHPDTPGAVGPMADETLQNGEVGEAVSPSPKMGGPDFLAGERSAHLEGVSVTSLQNGAGNEADSTYPNMGGSNSSAGEQEAPLQNVSVTSPRDGEGNKPDSTSHQTVGAASSAGKRAGEVACFDIRDGCVDERVLGFYSKDEVFASLTAVYRPEPQETVYGLEDQTNHHYQDRPNRVGNTNDCVVQYHLEVAHTKINQYQKIEHYLGDFEEYLCGDKSLFRCFKTFWSSLIDSHRKRVSYTWLNTLVFQSQLINTSLKKMVARFSYALSIINLNNIRVYSKRVGINIDVESRMKTQTEVQDNLCPSDRGGASLQNRDLFRDNGEEALFRKLITNEILPWELDQLNRLHPPSEASSNGLMDCTDQPNTRHHLRPTQHGLNRFLLEKSSISTTRPLGSLTNGKENL